MCFHTYKVTPWMGVRLPDFDILYYIFVWVPKTGGKRFLQNLTYVNLFSELHNNVE